MPIQEPLLEPFGVTLLKLANAADALARAAEVLAVAAEKLAAASERQQKALAAPISASAAAAVAKPQAQTQLADPNLADAVRGLNSTITKMIERVERAAVATRRRQANERVTD